MSFERMDGEFPMSELDLRISDLGKLYKLARSRHALSLRETLASAFAVPRRKQTHPTDLQLQWREGNRLSSKLSSKYIGVLKNLSLELKKGETVGIIGLNGPGKSTLLKILAEITEQTEGEVCIVGRLTAAIKLGAGFQVEFSGDAGAEIQRLPRFCRLPELQKMDFKTSCPANCAIMPAPTRIA